MITVSNGFRTAQKQNTKQLKAYVTDGTDQINEDDDLKSVKIEGSGSLCKSIMRQAEAKYLDAHDYLDKWLNVGMGVEWTKYQWQKTITVDHTQVPSTLSDYVMYFTHTDNDLKSVANGGRVFNGTYLDVRFVGADGTQLKHEVIEYNATTGLISAWVKIPSLSHTADTVITMQFGWEFIDASQEAVADVWTDYSGVWHMNDLTTSTVKDSTANANNGTKTGASEPIEATGKIGKAQTYDGINDSIVVTKSASLTFGGTTPISIEAWVNMDSPVALRRIWTHGNEIVLRITAFGQVEFIMNTFTGATDRIVTASSLFTTAGWHHVVATYDGTKMRIYLNGEMVKDGTPSGTYANDANNPRIGNTGSELWDGSIDEVRVLQSALSTDRIAVDFVNQNGVVEFYSTSGSIQTESNQDNNTSTEYIDYGTFKVVKLSTDEGSDVTTIKMFDRMYEANQEWGLDLEYPKTLLEVVQAICTELGWTLGSLSFPNDSLSITGAIFDDLQLTYRKVLDMVAEATGCVVYFNNEDELIIKAISATVVDTVDKYDFRSLELESKWGPCNSIVLSRMPQEDNILQKDDASIATNGLTELKIINNLIVDADRETWISEIYDALNGVQFFPFKAETYGLGWFEFGDRIKVKDLAGTEYEVLVLDMTLEVGTGFKETVLAKIPDKTSTAYKYAGIIGQRITNTEIIVNKQQAEIDLINSTMEEVFVLPRQADAPADPNLYDLWLDTDTNIIMIWDGDSWEATSLDPAVLGDYYTKDETTAQISLTTDSIVSSVESAQQSAQTALANAEANADGLATLQSQMTVLEQQADALQVTVEGIGGVNLLKNSVGLKGDIKDWQIFDESGTLVDARNSGTIVQTTDVQNNSESGSGIQLVDQFITETFATIEGNTYTAYFRYYKNAYDIEVTITGIASAIAITGGTDEWGVFKVQFVASGSSATFRIENDDENALAIITDAVVKLGDVSGWIQAPNEVYGKNFRFDKDGFQITSLTDKFKALLDNTKLAIYDTSTGSDKIVMLVSKDLGKITKLTAQDEFVLQRYENSASSTRMIPTSTGSMLVVND